MIKIYHHMHFKSKEFGIIENLKKWFNLKFEIIYFYNVYGPNQIKEGAMATVIGIFEYNYRRNKKMPVDYGRNQTRRFTHINDTIKFAMKLGLKINARIMVFLIKNHHSILEVAKIFKKPIKYLKKDLVKDILL